MVQSPRRLGKGPSVTPQEQLQEVQFLDKYARWNPNTERRETWDEAVDRVMSFFASTLTPLEKKLLPWEGLTKRFRERRVLPSMRVLQMAGPSLERCHVGAYNCAYLELDNPRALSEMLYILMQSTGVGFSVERRVIRNWPVVLPFLTHEKPEHFKIPDTTEGWADAFGMAIRCGLNGIGAQFDYSAIRPRGARLKTKGGYSSGPEPLRALLEFTGRTIRSREGTYLRPIDVYDLACYAAQIVEVGGVRRAATICLCDLDDTDMRDAKRGEFWLTHPWRSQANNSAVHFLTTSKEDFYEEFEALRTSGTGERGIFNRDSASFPEAGTNPCGEIILRSRQFCNLSQVVATRVRSPIELCEDLEYATLFGTLQARLTNFSYISPEWKRNCEEERLLGVDITGQKDVPEDWFTPEWLAEYKATVRRTADFYADYFEIAYPRAVTCVKPSGNSSVLLDCASGLHGRFAPYYLRRVRLAAFTPLANFLRQNGVPMLPEVGELGMDTARRWVAEFPVASPVGARTRYSLDEMEQLDYWLRLKQHYTDHNPSCTIYVRPEKWDEVQDWCWKNRELVGGLSFLPQDNGHYQLAPYEEITKEEYDRRVAAFPQLPFKNLWLFEHGDTTTGGREYACTAQGCEL